MAVQQDRSIQGRRIVARYLMLEELAQEKRLLPQSVCARIGRKQISQLVSKHRRAARLQHDDGPSGLEPRTEHVQDSLQIRLRLYEHAEIVERPPAA